MGLKPTSCFFGTQHINHGYLAVDFFFVLSGFVIGYAYDDRWDRMSTWSFFKRRLIRLHPMVVAGTLFGACLFFFGESDYFSLIGGTEPWKFFLCIVLGLLMIPAGTGLDIRGWGETNSLNGPNWSLTFEYIGNILYAFVLRRLPTVVLGMLCVASAFLTMNLALGWDVFGFFAQPKYDVIGGWSITPDQMYVGFSRLLYPFLCGLLISRLLPKFITKRKPERKSVGHSRRFLVGFAAACSALCSAANRRKIVCSRWLVSGICHCGDVSRDCADRSG